MTHFDALKIYSIGKHCEKRRNCLLQAISPFLTMFSILYGTYFHFKCTLKCCLQLVSIWTSVKFCRLLNQANVKELFVEHICSHQKRSYLILKEFKPWSDQANGRVTDKKSLYPFISVLCLFLMW